MPLPDDVLIYPGHGAGSPCGKSLGSEMFDSLGNQRKINYALSIQSKKKFAKYLDSVAKPPDYFF